MSKESYINGFCKTAASMGVNPSALADFIQKIVDYKGLLYEH